VIIILICTFFLLLFLGVPMAFSVGISAFCAIYFGSEIPSVMIVQQIYSGLDSFSLMAVPLFILTGQLMNKGGITKRIINFSKIFVGHIRGGLSHVNVIASMIFAGISGSSTADAAGIGAILIPAMIEEGYEEDWAVCITAASSTVGPIIPPSVLMIVYGCMTQLSIGKLFIAGLIPGIMVGLVLILAGYILAIVRKRKGGDFNLTIKEILIAVKESWPTLLTPLIIIIGITGGIFTATEAGCIATVYALIIGIIYKEINVKNFIQILYDTAKNTTVILFLIACATTFGWVISYADIPAKIVTFLLSLNLSPSLNMLFVIILMLIIGLFIDGMAAILVFVPVLFPLGNMLGFDPYHFATVLVVCIMIGAVTPPVGILLYISCGINKISIRKVTPLIWWFVLALICVLLLIAFIPPLVTFLPNLFF
jgi:tripartite ATP-independent transporter DctM subunit